MKKKLFEYKIKNRYIIYFILIGYVMGCFLGPVVHNVNAFTFNSYDFENGTVGQRVMYSDTDFFFSENNSNYGVISNTLAYSGTKSFYSGIASPGSGYSYFRNHQPGHSSDALFNATGSSFRLWAGSLTTNARHVEVSYNSNNGTKYISYDIYRNWIILRGIGSNYKNMTTSGNNSNTWILCEWSRVNNTYSWYNFSSPTWSFNELYQNDNLYNYSIIRLVFTEFRRVSGYTAWGCYIDDYSITHGFLGSAPSCGSYESIGVIGISEEGAINDPSSRYMVAGYNVDGNYTIMRIDVQISYEMYMMPLSTWHLKLNQHDIGSPGYSFVMTGETYILSWVGLNLIINDELVLFILRSSAVDSNSNYFSVPYTVSDINDDGSSSILFLSSSNGGYFDNFNTLYNSFVPNPLFSYSDKEIIIRFCVQRKASELHNYPNLLYLEEGSICRNSSARAYYSVNYSNAAKTKKLFFDPPGAVSLTKSYSLIGEAGFYSFFFNDTGTYRINLSVNGVNISSKSVIVAGCERHNWIYTIPNPSSPCQSVNMFYQYSSNVSDGIIKLYDDSGREVFSKGVVKQSKGSLSLSVLCSSGIYRADIISFFSAYNVTYEKTSLESPYYHFVGRMTPAFLDADRYNISLGNSVIFLGYHSFVGSDVFIKVGQQYIKNVGSYDDFIWSYTPSKAGVFSCSLVLRLPGDDEIVLHTMSNSLVISKKAVHVVPGTGQDDVFPHEMKLLFGICCILVAVSCPLMISVKYHVAVPSFVYVIFMSLGIGIGTVLGFLELWLVFLFVVALVAGAVFTIFGHGSSGGGGGGGDSGTIRKGGILSRRGSKDYAGASRKADYGVSPKGSPGYLKGPGRRGY